MSATTGRMSRADAQHILQAIPPALREFSTPDASPATLQEVAALAAWHGFLQDALDRGRPHSAAEIRDLRTRVAALQAARLSRSETEPVRVTSAVCITAYGTQADDMASAAAYAERLLSGPVRLQDSSHVRSATLTGTRYIFTSRTP
jgi:hypothetical protein